MNNEIDAKEWHDRNSNGKISLYDAIQSRSIRFFEYKKDAIKAGYYFGWKSAVRVIKKYENGYVVGNLSFQPFIDEYELEWNEVRVPLLRWERRDDGVVYCPVVSFVKIRTGEYL